MAQAPASDEPKKSQEQILEQEIEAGLLEIERSRTGTCLSALVAGLEVGVSMLLMGVVTTLLPDGPDAVRSFLVAGAYSVGFVFVILGRSELFTEHTTLAVLPVLARRSRFRDLIEQWGLVLGGNLVGAIAISAMLAWIGPRLDAVSVDAYTKLAHTVIDHPSGVMFGSAVMAGWLMGLVSWLVTASRDTTSQVLMIVLVTGSIGLAGLHHSILGTVEVLCAVFAGADVTVVDYLRFLGLSVAGNAVGGVFFVALLKYAHAKNSD